MKINKDNTYLFLKGNKNGIIKHQPEDLFGDDFTILTKFKPDFKYIEEEVKTNPYHSMGLVSKNGKHMGLFFTSGYDAEGEWFFKISFEWWETTLNPDEDKVNAVDIFRKSSIIDKELSVAVWRKDDELFIRVGDEVVMKKLGNLIDYQYSYTWIGAANRLYDDFNHIFVGDISFMHLQEGILTREQQDLGFKQYNEFVDSISKNREIKTIFTSNFEENTFYKVKDDSNNFNHIIKFSKEWLN